MDDTKPVEVQKGHISRRAVIAGGATGAAAFWAVPIIDSMTSLAGATGVGSGCTPVTGGSISYIWVIFTKGGVTYFGGYSAGNAWTQGTLKIPGTSLCTSPCGPYCTPGFNGGAATGDITGPGGNLVYVPGTNATSQVLSLSGVAVLTVNNSAIVPGTGVVIDAWFIFQAGTATGHCPASTGSPPCEITFD